MTIALVDLQVQSAVLHTSSALSNISFSAPAPAEIPKRKLRRMPGGNPEALGKAGQNFRVFALENPCLLCEYTSSKAVLLVRNCLLRYISFGERILRALQALILAVPSTSEGAHFVQLCMK